MLNRCVRLLAGPCIQLKQFEIDPSLYDSLELPVAIQSVTVGTLEARLPVFDLLGSPIEVRFFPQSFFSSYGARLLTADPL